MTLEEFKEDYVEPNLIDILEAVPIKTEDVKLEDTFVKEEYVFMTHQSFL